MIAKQEYKGERGKGEGQREEGKGEGQGEGGKGEGQGGGGKGEGQGEEETVVEAVYCWPVHTTVYFWLQQTHLSLLSLDMAMTFTDCKQGERH